MNTEMIMTILMVLDVVIALLLIIAVVLQPGKSGGMEACSEDRTILWVDEDKDWKGCWRKLLFI